jgi:hypothetical protein
MNYFKSTVKIILVLFSIIVVLLLLSLLKVNKRNEQFTSGFREMYRPHIRNVRLISDNYYNKLKTNTKLFFRKFGLI